jgi:hypothetical protein
MASRALLPARIIDQDRVVSIASIVSGPGLACVFKMHGKSDAPDLPTNSELHAPPADGAGGHARLLSGIGSGNAFFRIKRTKDPAWVPANLARQTAPSRRLEDGADGDGGRPMEDKSPRHSKNTRRERDPFHAWASQATKFSALLQTGSRIHSALGGTSQAFFGPSARSIAFSAAATASARLDA